MGQIRGNNKSQRSTEDPTSTRKHEAFREQLASESASAGTECATHGELFAAGSHAGEKEICEIDAHDEKNEADSAPENKERAAKFAADVILERRDIRRVFLIPLRVRGA